MTHRDDAFPRSVHQTAAYVELVLSLYAQDEGTPAVHRVTYTCGHTQDVAFHGDPARHPELIARHESGPCPECFWEVQ